MVAIKPPSRRTMPPTTKAPAEYLDIGIMLRILGRETVHIGLHGSD
jgi:hypothetical protein